MRKKAYGPNDFVTKKTQHEFKWFIPNNHTMIRDMRKCPCAGFRLLKLRRHILYQQWHKPRYSKHKYRKTEGNTVNYMGVEKHLHVFVVVMQTQLYIVVPCCQSRTSPTHSWGQSAVGGHRRCRKPSLGCWAGVLLPATPPPVSLWIRPTHL